MSRGKFIQSQVGSLIYKTVFCSWPDHIYPSSFNVILHTHTSPQAVCDLGKKKKIAERTRQQEISFQSKQSDKQRALHPSCCVKINHCSGLVRYSNGRSSKNVLITCTGGVLDDPQPICAVFTHESTGNVSQNITVSSVSSTVKTIAALIE